jgi:hypothetical protein
MSAPNADVDAPMSAHGKTGFFREFRESSAGEPNATVFASGVFSFLVRRFE